jgi:hypothetical protein
MKRILLMTVATTTALMISTHSQIARAWGQYGHQQINTAAVTLVSQTGEIGRCLSDADYTMRRLAISPDMEWKMDVKVELAEDILKKRMQDDQYEHSLHFFEADAFVPLKGASAAILKLPSGEYSSAYASYHTLLTQYIDQVTTIDPSKSLKNPKDPSVNEVTAHGTAPWRAEQLYRLAVDAMKKGDTQLALLYLGTMGHYVGDMSQPFHATLNFDGGYPANAAHAGIHHEIDTGLLPGASKKSKTDPDNKDAMSVFPSALFQKTTQPAIVASAEIKIKDAGKKSLTAEDIVPEMLKLVSTGIPYVDALLAAYQTQCDLKNGSSPKAPAAGDAGAATKMHCVATQKGGHSEVDGVGKDGETAMLATTITVEGSAPMTVAQVLNERMAMSSALLARLWIAAYKDAGSPSMGDCKKFGAFDTAFRDYVIQNYPRPNDPAAYGFMPAGYHVERGLGSGAGPKVNDEHVESDN